MTKTPHGPGSHEACSAYVTYKGISEACKRAGTHPDPDGKRFWCGLHRPEARLKREQEKTDRVAEAHETAVAAVENNVKAEMMNEVLESLEEARKALIEISNLKDTGWPEGTSVDKYQVLLSHLNTLASNAHERTSAVIRKVQAEIGRASRAA